MNQKEAAREAEIFKKYLTKRKILIADASSSARSSLFKVLHDLGARTEQLILVSSYNQAEASIVSEKPHIVISEYDLGKRCGLELMQNQRAQHPNDSKDSIFIIVTANTSQAAVARSAEEDIDTFIIKPFTMEVVRKIILKAAVDKIKPGEYRQAIDLGKLALAANDLVKAESEFVRAAQLDVAPALAHAYCGQAKHLGKHLSEAKQSYNTGLKFNRIHYKSMLGLYDILMAERDFPGAYEVIRRISQYFPVNSQRLAEVLRLAIVTGKYEDIEKYYNVFINIDERNDTLIKYICSALIVCGKYYLGNKLASSRALELFRKAAATGTGRSFVLREIISSLLEYQLFKEANIFLARYPAEEMAGAEYVLLNYLVRCGDARPEYIIEQGRLILARNILDPRLFAVMLRAAAESGLRAYAEELFLNGSSRFPEQKSFFEGVLGKARPRSA